MIHDFLSETRSKSQMEVTASLPVSAYSRKNRANSRDQDDNDVLWHCAAPDIDRRIQTRAGGCDAGNRGRA